jgi:excisionase family DNA binding protein
MTDRLEAAVAELVAAIRDEIATERPAAAPERLLDVDETASALGIGRSKVYGEIAAGRLRSLTVGRRRLIAASAVADFIQHAGRA